MRFLSRHKNFELTRTIFKDGEEILTVTNYRDADTCFWGGSDGRDMLCQADVLVDRELYDEKYVYIKTIFDSSEACQGFFEDSRNAALIIVPEEEPLLETKDTGDGRFTAVTEIRDSELVRQLLAEAEPVGGCTFAEGMSLRYEHTFDKESSDLLSIDCFLTDAEGESTLYSRDSYAYDMEDYDPAAEGEPFAEYKAAVAVPELSRTITVTFSPDTAKERVIVCDLPKAAYFYIFSDEQYVDDIYTDRACTQLFETSDGVSDLELFVK